MPTVLVPFLRGRVLWRPEALGRRRFPVTLSLAGRDLSSTDLVRTLPVEMCRTWDGHLEPLDQSAPAGGHLPQAVCRLRHSRPLVLCIRSAWEERGSQRTQALRGPPPQLHCVTWVVRKSAHGWMLVGRCLSLASPLSELRHGVVGIPDMHRLDQSEAVWRVPRRSSE